MIKFYNTHPAYGFDGPFEANSKQELIDGMEETFQTWAGESADEAARLAEEQGSEFDRDAYIEAELERMRDEYEEALEPQWHGKPRVVFDNGGGITVQLPKWCHWYNNAGQAADDVRAYIEAPSVAGWDGNEPDAVFEPTDEQIRNGGYRIWMIGDDPLDCTWGNVQDFFTALNPPSYADIKERLGWDPDFGEEDEDWYTHADPTRCALVEKLRHEADDLYVFEEGGVQFGILCTNARCDALDEDRLQEIREEYPWK